MGEVRTPPIRIWVRKTTSRWGDGDAIELVHVLTQCQCQPGIRKSRRWKYPCYVCWFEECVRDGGEDALSIEHWPEVASEGMTTLTVCVVDSESHTPDGSDYDSWIEEWEPPKKRAKA